MNKVINTKKRAQEEPFLGLMDALNIEASELRGQKELEQSSQLPFKIGHRNDMTIEEVTSIYEKYGIKVLKQSNGDELFVDVILPEGWKIKGTSHSMWNNLIDQNGRIRASFFYKAAFYDRDAFLTFKTRYSINTVTYLPQDEKGHYEKRTVTIEIRPNGLLESGRRREMYYECEDGCYPMEFRKTYKEVEEDVWIKKYKDHYEEINNTPMYFEILDGEEVVYSTKDKPVLFKREYKKEEHGEWWREQEKVEGKLKTDAKDYLNNLFPEWEDETKYF